MKAIEGAVLEIIEQGYEKGFWVLQNNNEGVELKDETINKPDCDADCIDNIRG
jgi:hypothetical protein